MCCKCCGVTQQKVWVFGLGILFSVLGLLGIICWPTWAENIIMKQMPLTPTSRTFSLWNVTPVPIYMHMYLFNWTNPEDVRKPGVKPNFQQLGPYVFREVRAKEDLVWHKNKTLTFYGSRTWFHEPKMSGGSLDDRITAPHLPTISAANFMRDQPWYVKEGFAAILKLNGGSLYQTHTANEWLFEGFYDQLLHFARSMNNSFSGNITSDYFAWFYGRNGSKTFEGDFTIHTGQNDLRQMGELKFWKGQNHTGFFEGECGRLNGSTGDLWVPNRAADEYITFFVTDTCRILNLVPTAEKVVIEGVEGVKYATNEDTFDNGQDNPDMKCYCPRYRQPDDCPKKGATDLGPCSEGAPMYLSHSNFMYADPSYADTITGMNPNYKRDAFYISMEPKLGVPLDVNAAIQVSLHVRADKFISIIKGIPEFYAPLFVISSKAKISPKLARYVRLAHNAPNIGRYAGIGMLTLGVILIAVGIYLTITKNWRGQKKFAEQVDECHIEKTEQSLKDAKLN